MTLDFRIGKFYRANDGQKVIYAYDRVSNTYRDKTFFNETGRKYLRPQIEAEWTDAPQPVRSYPKLKDSVAFERTVNADALNDIAWLRK